MYLFNSTNMSKGLEMSNECVRLKTYDLLSKVIANVGNKKFSEELNKLIPINKNTKMRKSCVRKRY